MNSALTQHNLSTNIVLDQYSVKVRRRYLFRLYCVYSTALLLYCPTALLPYCHTALLLYCPTALLLYCSIALLLYCPTALLLYYQLSSVFLYIKLAHIYIRKYIACVYCMGILYLYMCAVFVYFICTCEKWITLLRTNNPLSPPNNHLSFSHRNKLLDGLKELGYWKAKAEELGMSTSINN